MTSVFFLSDLWPPFPGGAERLAFNLARDLMRRDFDVDVLTGYGNAQQFDGPPITIREDIGVFDNRDAGAAIVAEHLEQLNPDVIVSHHLYARQFEPELQASGIPLVHVVLNGERIQWAALGVYITEWVRQRADPKPHDLTIIPPAFEDVIADSHEDAIGFIKPIPHKGIELLYEVARRLPDRKFVVLRGEWQTLEIIRPAENIEFLEPVDDIRDFYKRVRILLMPSQAEDAGTVAQEATLNGLPCISSNVDGLRETNAGGVLRNPDDVDGFVEWIKALDRLDVYANVVARQRKHLDAVMGAGRLDELAARIEHLSRF